MRFIVGTVAARRSSLVVPLLRGYVERINRYAPCELRDFSSEAKLMGFLDSAAGRTTPGLILSDSRGQTSSSEEFASAVGRLRDSGLQQVVVAVGPPNGWSPEALRQATLTISFGRITLPHDLAAVIATEQLYRALTILAGHPYHSGH